jgi:NTE family protein
MRNTSLKIGLALSGGGAKGLAHLGVLKALDENHLRPSVISGASAGAIAGAFYACGYAPDEILDLIMHENILKLARPSMSLRGLLKMENTSLFYERYLVKNIEELKIPLIINATEIRFGKTVYFSSGNLIKAIQASSCIPAIFEPITIDDNVYVDGGILNNLPLEPIVAQCDKLIGVHANPHGDFKDVKNLKMVLERTFLLSIAQNVYAHKHLCDLFIEPAELANYNVFSLNDGKKIFDIGYQGAKKALEKIAW